MGPDEDDELDALDWLLLELLNAGFTHEKAATFAECSSRTVQRRSHKPAFRRELAQRRHDALAVVAAKLAAATEQAVNVLVEEMQPNFLSPSTRVRAAGLVFDNLRRVTADLESLETGERLDDVEEAIEELRSTQATPIELVDDEETT